MAFGSSLTKQLISKYCEFIAKTDIYWEQIKC